jgi:hypothetical protein
MQTYNPSESTLISEIRTPSIEEDLARKPKPEKGIPTGLLEPEKKIDESQMADFSTPIDELMDDSQGGFGSAPAPSPSGPSGRPAKASGALPLGLTEEQFQAGLAGLAAVLAFSKPVQEKLSTLVPKFLNESGDASLTGLVVTALVAAILFYFAKKFIAEKSR